VKLAEVRPFVHGLADSLASGDPSLDREIRTALETAFVEGARSGLKFVSNAKFAAVFAAGEADSK
jgi:hypothetical protein